MIWSAWERRALAHSDHVECLLWVRSGSCHARDRGPHQVYDRTSKLRAASRGGKGDRWRECDWNPTVSEFVATILLGQVRLGSNCRPVLTQESAALVREVRPLKRCNLSLSALLTSSIRGARSYARVFEAMCGASFPPAQCKASRARVAPRRSFCE